MRKGKKKEKGGGKKDDPPRYNARGITRISIPLGITAIDVDRGGRGGGKKERGGGEIYHRPILSGRSVISTGQHLATEEGKGGKKKGGEGAGLI